MRLKSVVTFVVQLKYVFCMLHRQFLCSPHASHGQCVLNLLVVQNWAQYLQHTPDYRPGLVDCQKILSTALDSDAGIFRGWLKCHIKMLNICWYLRTGWNYHFKMFRRAVERKKLHARSRNEQMLNSHSFGANVFVVLRCLASWARQKFFRTRVLFHALQFCMLNGSFSHFQDISTWTKISSFFYGLPANLEICQHCSRMQSIKSYRFMGPTCVWMRRTKQIGKWEWARVGWLWPNGPAHGPVGQAQFWHRPIIFNKYLPSLASLHSHIVCERLTCVHHIDVHSHAPKSRPPINSHKHTHTRRTGHCI